MDSIPLDLKVFQNHVGCAEFKLARYEKRWEILEIVWPVVVVRIYVGSRSNAPDFYDFRFDCGGDYPNVPATATLWDFAAKQSLPYARWPAGRFLIPSIFNPNWKNGHALYIPCDRQAIEGHNDWPMRYPLWLWKSNLGIIHYIRILHGLLNSSDYTGIRGT